MKGYIYVCEMEYKGETYYKIGKALNIAKREAELKVGNPFLTIIAFKNTQNYHKVEKNIHYSFKEYHFSGEWFKLPRQKYENLVKIENFIDFSDIERQKQLKFGYSAVPLRRKTEPLIKFPLGGYHVFKKQKKTKAGDIYFRWYYYYVNELGAKIQKACIGCSNRTEAESFIRTLPALEI
jgi:hypothetical protein